MLYKKLVSLLLAETLSGRALLGCALRHVSANFPASRPVNVRRVVPPSRCRETVSRNIPHAGAATFYVFDAQVFRCRSHSFCDHDADAEGRFALEMPPGDYSARVTAQGMSPQVTPQLHVDVGGAAEFEFRLTIAGAQETVSVSSAPSLVETKTSSVSTLLDERAVNDLPLNGRRFADLALLSPGVTQDPRSLTSATNGDLFGGIRGFQNTFLVDGGDYNNAFFAQARGRYCAPFQFSTEVVQEFRVSSNAYGAEQGRSGGAW